MLHLLADVEEVVFDVLEHADLGDDEFAETVALERDLFAEVEFGLVEVGGDLAGWGRAYRL